MTRIADTQAPETAAEDGVALGWLARDLPFLTRTLRFLLREDSDGMRRALALEPGEIGVLAVVAQNPGISQNGLAGSLVLKKSAVTKVVQALERRGLIERRRSKTDRRSNALSLTEDGVAMAAEMRRAASDLHALWFAGMAEAERAQFFAVLNRIIAGLQARGVSGADAE